MTVNRLTPLTPNEPLLDDVQISELKVALGNLDELEKRVERAKRMGIEPEITLQSIQDDRARIRKILDNA